MELELITTHIEPDSLELTIDGLANLDSDCFKIVDKEKAKAIVQYLLSHGRKIYGAWLGIDGDWNENNCLIFDGTEYFEYDKHEGSRWALPVLYIEYQDGPSETYACWKPRPE